MLDRAKPSSLLAEPAPAATPRPFGFVPWAALLGSALVVLPSLAALAERQDVEDVIQQFRVAP